MFLGAALANKKIKFSIIDKRVFIELNSYWAKYYNSLVRKSDIKFLIN